MSAQIEGDRWYYEQDGKLRGPVPMSRLAELACRGVVREDTQVSQDRICYTPARGVLSSVFRHASADAGSVPRVPIDVKSKTVRESPPAGAAAVGAPAMPSGVADASPRPREDKTWLTLRAAVVAGVLLFLLVVVALLLLDPSVVRVLFFTDPSPPAVRPPPGQPVDEGAEDDLPPSPDPGATYGRAVTTGAGAGGGKESGGSSEGGGAPSGGAGGGGVGAAGESADGNARGFAASAPSGTARGGREDAARGGGGRPDLQGREGGGGEARNGGEPRRPVPPPAAKEDREAWERAVACVKGRLTEPDAAHFPTLGDPGTAVRHVDRGFEVHGFVDALSGSGRRRRVQFSCVLVRTGNSLQDIEVHLEE